jgi:hypothetical protein
VPVYLSPREQIRTIHGQLGSASFFAPWDRDIEPYIKIATGDYIQLSRKRGRDDALAAFIVSMSHEVIHYQHWVATGGIREHGVARQATAMMRRYAITVDRP